MWVPTQDDAIVMFARFLKARHGTAASIVARTWRPGVFERSSSKQCEFRHLGYYRTRDNLGYHAFREKEQAKREAFFQACSSPCVIGSVAMWGEVIEHKRGWRSEYAAVRSITEIAGDISVWTKQWLLHELRAKYRCAVVIKI